MLSRAARHPIFVALAETIKRVRHSQGAVCGFAGRVPPGPDGARMETMQRCAGILPLLRESRWDLVLYVCGYRDVEMFPAVRLYVFCAAACELLAGCSRGLRKDRIYIPLARHAGLQRERRGDCERRGDEENSRTDPIRSRGCAKNVYAGDVRCSAW